MSKTYKRRHIERAGGDGWTRWVQPVKRGYLFSCCDCGLTHWMDFRIVDARVQFKAKRAPLYTKRARLRMRSDTSPARSQLKKEAHHE